MLLSAVKIDRRAWCGSVENWSVNNMTDRRNMVFGLMAGLAAVSQVARADEVLSEADAQAAIDSFLDALFSGDPLKIEQVLAPEFQILRSDGERYDKQSYLEALPKHKVRPVTSVLKFTGHDRIIVASYMIRTQQTIGGKPVEAVSPRLSVFRKEEDQWLIISHANFAQIG